MRRVCLWHPHHPGLTCQPCCYRKCLARVSLPGRTVVQLGPCGRPLGRRSRRISAVCELLPVLLPGAGQPGSEGSVHVKLSSADARKSPWNTVFQKPAFDPQPQDLELLRERRPLEAGAEHPSLVRASGRVARLSPHETSVPGAQTPTLPGGGRQPQGGKPGTGD